MTTGTRHLCKVTFTVYVEAVESDDAIEQAEDMMRHTLTVDHRRGGVETRVEHHPEE